MEFARVVRKRRMIRAFKPVSVPETKMRRVLELAQHYPRAGFSQGVAFILITEPERIRSLGELTRLRGADPARVFHVVTEGSSNEGYNYLGKIRRLGTRL